MVDMIVELGFGRIGCFNGRRVSHVIDQFYFAGLCRLTLSSPINLKRYRNSGKISQCCGHRQELIDVNRLATQSFSETYSTLYFHAHKTTVGDPLNLC